MPSAVSNASPLIHLAAIGRFSLLRDFFDEVVIPPSVWREVVDEGGGRPGTQAVQEAANTGWIRVEALSSDTLARFLRRDLDDGEADSIALAVEISPSVILLDESEARRLAELYSLKKTGVVGLLVRAKNEAKITSLKEELDRLRDEAGFWLHDDLYEQALHGVGEASKRQ